MFPIVSCIGTLGPHVVAMFGEVYRTFRTWNLAGGSTPLGLGLKIYSSLHFRFALCCLSSELWCLSFLLQPPAVMFLHRYGLSAGTEYRNQRFLLKSPFVMVFHHSNIKQLANTFKPEIVLRMRATICMMLYFCSMDEQTHVSGPLGFRILDCETRSKQMITTV